MGFANSPETRDTLAAHGIRVSGYRWRWALGLKGGTYPPHYHQNNERVTDAGDFEALPGEDVNGSACMCALVPEYRTPDGRFAKPGLAPVFQPPATASGGMYDGITVSRDQLVFDWGPLHDFMTQLAERPTSFTLSVPDGAFVVNLPELSPTFHVAAPRVNVEAPDVTVQPSFAVESPTVNVQPPTVNVAAPTVNVEPRIEVKPVVKVIREKVAKAVRFRRNANGQIEEAEVTSEQ